MRKGIYFIASALAGAMLFLCSGTTVVCANEEIKYLELPKPEETGQEAVEEDPEKAAKKEEELLKELLQKAKELPIETDALENWPKGPQICGEAGIVMDMDNGAILYGKSMDKKYYPASITKIMTALLALEHSQMSDLVTFSAESIQCQRNGYAHIAMKEGEQITMKDALHAMMLASANEVAYAIGETIGGTHEKFVQMMNERAKELGCENTHFMNTNGMSDENHYVSARDMALIAREAFSKSELLDIVQTREYTIPPTNLGGEPRTFQQKHKMLAPGKYHDDRCIAGKTGYTTESFNTLVTVFEENGRRLITVILGSRDETVENTKALADYGFQQFETLSVAEHEKAEELADIPDDATVTVPKSLSFEKLKYKEDNSGKVTYFYKGNPVGTMSAAVTKEQKLELEQMQPAGKEAEEQVDEEEKFRLPETIRRPYIIVGIVIVLLFFILVVVKIRRRRMRMRRRREREIRRRQRMQDRNRRS